MENAGGPCLCGVGTRSVQCHDCLMYEPSCAECFLKYHARDPFHWALVWDPNTGHYRKCDFTAVGPSTRAIQFGHSRPFDPFQPCPYSDCDIGFNIIHLNGIHSSKVRFCECPGSPDRMTQLMAARLFPGTPDEPKTAFTFSSLKQFRLLNLQSKCGAFDYVLTLRRLTDNVFTEGVPVSLIRHSPPICL